MPAVILGVLLCFFAGPDNDVEWNGVSHVGWQDRRPLAPVNGEAFDVLLQAYQFDLTAVKLHVVDNGAPSTIDAAFDHDRGPYAVWKAHIPAMSGNTLTYYFELIDGADSDYYGASGVSETVPTGGALFTIDKLTLSHAAPGVTPVTGGVLFKVWAPNAAQAWVRGTFNGWSLSNPMTKHGDYFVVKITGTISRQEYKYYFEPGALWRSDARGRAFNSAGGYNSYVENYPAYVWGDAAHATPAFEDMIIYELHVGTFSGRNDPQASGAIPGTYRDVAAHAGHLAELGVNMVELMPVTEFPTDFSIGYNPISMWAPEYKLGTPDDLRYMIDTLHQHGIGVMHDIVWNHFSGSDNYLWNYDSGTAQIYFRVPDVQTPWGSQADFGRGEVREYYQQSALAWLEEYHLDGFRMDATDFMNIFPQEAAGWSLMQWFNDTLDNRWINKIAIAEQLPNDSYVTRPTSLGGAGFDAQWHDAWTDSLRAAVYDAAFGDPNIGWLAGALNGDGEYLYGPYLLRYFELHDEILTSTGGSRAVRNIDPSFPHDDFFARSRTKLAQGLTMFVPGIPMIIMGSEWLEDTNFAAGDASGADRIDWAKKTTYADYFAFFRDMIAVRKGNGAFRANAGWQTFHVNEGGNVLAFQRYDADGNICVVVGNFANTDYFNYRVGLPQAGQWDEILNSQSALYGGNNVGNGGSITSDDTDYDGFAQSASITIPQSGLLVFRWAPPPPCPGDLDQDGDVDLSDLGIVLAAFGVNGSGDTDGDGDTDLSDLGVVLAAYGVPCP